MLDKAFKYGALIGVTVILSILWIPVLGGFQSPSISGEWMQLDWIQRIVDGDSFYQPSSGFVEGVTPAYSPLYYYGAGGLSRLGMDSLSAGRLYSLVGAFIGLVSIYLVCEVLTKRKWVGLLAILLVSLHPILRSDSVILRPDLFAWGLSMLTLVQVVKKRYWIALPVMVLAIFTKQTYIALPIVVGLYLFLEDRMHGWIWSGAFVTLSAITLGLLSWVTGGEAFKHIILYPLQSGEVSNTWQFASVAFMFMIIPVVFSIVYIVQYREVKSLMLLYFLVSVVVMVVLIGKDGAGINYSFEVLATGSVVTSLYFWRMIDERTRKSGNVDARVGASATPA